MTTTAQLLASIQRRIAPGKRPTINRLDGTIASDATTVTVEFDPDGVNANSRLSLDLEDVHVWSVAAKVATVERGQNGSSPAAHTTGALVYVNADPTPWDMVSAVNDELAALPGLGVARYETVTLTSSSNTGYDLTGVTGDLKIVKVAWYDSCSVQYRPVNRRLWRLDGDVPVSSFASGRAVMIRDPNVPTNVAVQVTYTTAFTALATLADDVESVSHLPARAHPLLALGAAIRLQTGVAPARARTDRQGDPRRSAEVTVDDARLSTSPLLVDYQRLLNAEKRLLIEEHGG